MTEPHIDSRTIKLRTPRGLESDVTVRALTALQLFEYQTYLVDVEWPAPPQEGDKKGSSRDLGEVEVDRQGAGKLAVSKHTTTITLLSP
ncbi:hypothetical protein U1740_19770, partial [Aeromonas caviae]|uniref:hypothetical protein n=1 Tax=Aeromonas caviae TaxID=648 RepID=UPI003014461A